MKGMPEKGNVPSNYYLTLYTAGDEPNSLLAIKNLTAMCTGDLALRCVIEVVDVYQSFQRALIDRVIVTPTLIVSTVNPATKATFYGSLHDTKILLTHLGSGAF